MKIHRSSIADPAAQRDFRVVERADRGEFPKGWMTGPTQIWIAGIDPALILASPHCGLRYGFAPAIRGFPTT
jgi:hypothetical protein